MPRPLRPLFAKETWRGWAFFAIGAGLLAPYLVTAFLVGGALASHTPAWFHLLLLLVLLVVPMAVTGLVPAARAMEGTAAKELLGAPQTVGQGRTLPDRLRTSGWFVGHLLIGGGVGVLSLGLPTFCSVMFWAQFQARDSESTHSILNWAHGWVGSVLVTGSLLATAGAVYGLALLVAIARRVAVYALGPSQAERLAELEQRADRLAERNRLARELHDSVGHALSIVTVQAAAAGRVLDADPEFVRKALGAIEDSAREALEDLDHVLGLLREEASPSKAPQRTLGDLGDLLRVTGLKVDWRLDGDPARLPAAVSREAYRIVQEGLTNAVKHAGDVPVTLRLLVADEHLDLEMINPLGAVPGRAPGGGRGLTGIRERVRVLRGSLAAGPVDGRWRVAATIPLRTGGERTV